MRAALKKQVKNERFTFLMNEEERKMLEGLAETLYRSQGDTVRHLIYLEAKRMRKEGVELPEDVAAYIDSLPDPIQNDRLISSRIRKEEDSPFLR